ncbi:hypothetical protein MSI_15050 [Treponema sp. JC4]|uniref:hypothetical protein n=1 Tax=Treponema sp. JC4 TaxID=1124982 RepID=UPI00025B0731|nr:hypothetical protein [Treponema sp. JC4]EID85018.1 hypothetical protein MSI_15050 [Treponema sp. JC4]
MKISKILLTAAALSLATASLAADDFDDFGFDDFGSEGSSSSGSSLPIEFSGDLTLDVRDYFMVDDPKGIGETSIEATPQAKLGVKYDGGKAAADLQLKIDETTIKEYPIDVIDELTLSAYLGNFTLSAGKMKVVWGKGDKLHVIDNFNADDYTDFIIPDYLDRRISTPMIRGVYAVPLNSRTVSNVMIEGVYTPIMPVDRFASDGVWKPTKVSELEETVIEAVGTNLGLKQAAVDAVVATSTGGAAGAAIVTTAAYQTALRDYIEYQSYASSFSASNLYPDTNKFKYGQGGVRVTGSIGQVDLGLSYYYGHYKQPSVNLEKYAISKKARLLGSSSTPYALPELAYDKKQTFGLEFSTILWKFNLRGEGCFNLTDDVAGDDPWVHNNSIQWLGGFDIDLPFWDANLNVQETGTYILKNNKIEDSIYKTLDVDYAETGYTNNKLVVNFTTSFLNGKLAPEVTALYGFEHKDLVVMPKVTVKPASSFKIIASGLAMWTADEEKSEFGFWHKNSFVQLGAEVSF